MINVVTSEPHPIGNQHNYADTKLVIDIELLLLETDFVNLSIIDSSLLQYSSVFHCLSQHTAYAFLPSLLYSAITAQAY